MKLQTMGFEPDPVVFINDHFIVELFDSFVLNILEDYHFFFTYVLIKNYIF